MNQNMHYNDATAVLTDPLSVLTNRKRKKAQRSRHVILASGGTVVKVFYPGEPKPRYALSDIPAKPPALKLSGKLKRATIFQLTRWTRRVARRYAAVTDVVNRPEIPGKLRNLLYQKQATFRRMTLALLAELANRQPAKLATS